MLIVAFFSVDTTKLIHLFLAVLINLTVLIWLCSAEVNLKKDGANNDGTWTSNTLKEVILSGKQAWH